MIIIEVNKEAVKYIADMTGVGLEEAKEYLQVAIGMCVLRETDKPIVLCALCNSPKEGHSKRAHAFVPRTIK